MMNEAIGKVSRRRTFAAAALAAALCVLAGGLAYRAFLTAWLDGERRAASARLEVYTLSLDAALARYESLPALLALERDLAAALETPGDATRRAAANRYLETAQGDAAVAAAYLIDARGETLAASNWNTPRSFVGQNYSFRPYFRAAMDGRLGRFYGIGATTGEPGYFLAVPVRLRGRIAGAVAIKVALDAFEQALHKGGDHVLVADADGVVFLAAQAAWRYRTLSPLTTEARQRLAGTRQYGDHPLNPLAIGSDLRQASAVVDASLPGGKREQFLLQAKTVGQLGWQVVLLVRPDEARRSARSAGLATAFAVAFALALLFYLRLRRRRHQELAAADSALRRVHAELEARIAERTTTLTEKVAALESTEAILRQTRDAAVQAGKLAVLGQMAAGISHELNQPLTALRTLSDNAAALLDRGRADEARENLTLISQMIGRTGSIVAQLKAFMRGGPALLSAVPIGEAIEHALLIVEPRRRELGATIEVPPVAAGLQAIADSVRLEQVLVNLMRNGLDAMAGQPAPRLVLSLGKQNGRLRLGIRDYGPGIPAVVLPHLFEPFYTTKPVGEGLGLGLAISLTIVEGFRGSIEAGNADGGGAEFAILLDPAPAANDSGETK